MRKAAKSLARRALRFIHSDRRDADTSQAFRDDVRLFGVSAERYEHEMAQYEAKFAPHAAQPENQSVVDALTNDGICLVPNFLQRDVVRRLHDDGMEIGRALYANRLECPNVKQRWPEYGMCRLNSPENLLPESARLFASERIVDIAQAYLAGHARRMERYLDFKSENRPDANLQPHTDNIYRMLKVFFYLNDVPETHAPLIFWKRSHQKRPWRRLPDLLQYLEHDYGRYGHIPSNIYERLGVAPGVTDIERIECVATAGTAIFVDVSGLHSASLLRDGYRLMLVDNWMAFDNAWLHPVHRRITPPEGVV